MFLGHFDKDVRASVPFVLNRASGNDVLIFTAEGERVRRSIDAPDFANTYRVTMQWQTPVRLRLHVVEPGRRLGQLGDISDANPNGDGAAGLGVIDEAGAAPEQDGGGDFATSEQSYVLPDPRDRRRGVFTPYFEYVSRGSLPQLPFCGSGKLASASYRLFVIDMGRVTVDVHHESPPAACGVQLTAPQQRIQGLQ